MGRGPGLVQTLDRKPVLSPAGDGGVESRLLWVERAPVARAAMIVTVAGLENAVATARLFTVEENPRLCGWGAEIASIVAEECFFDLDGPVVRITTPHIPLPAADALEDPGHPSVDRIVETVVKGQ